MTKVVTWLKTDRQTGQLASHHLHRPAVSITPGSITPVYTQIQITEPPFFFNVVFCLYRKVKSIYISFPFHLVLSETNQKIISTQLSEKWQMQMTISSGNTSLALNDPKIQCQDYTTRNTETNTMASRGCKNYACATEKTELGLFQT